MLYRPCAKTLNILSVSCALQLRYNGTKCNASLRARPQKLQVCLGASLSLRLDNLTTQTTIRALNKLEFAYGLATRMAEAIGDQSPTTREMLGELLGYVEVTRSAVLLSAEHGRHIGDGIWFPDGRPLDPMRALLATWFPRVNEILMLIGSHNLLATPSRRDLDDPDLRPLIDEFLHGANNLGAIDRAALFRLAWDFVGSGLGGRNVLYERFYLTSAARNRMNHHLRQTDRSRANELVDGILASARPFDR